MKTTGRILTTLGIGAMVLGLAAFRSPATLQTDVPSSSSTWAQARVSPASLIQTSMDRSALAPATGTPTVASYVSDRNWQGHDQDQNRDRDKLKREQEKRKREQLERERREQERRHAEWLKKHKHEKGHRDKNHPDHGHDHR